MSFEANPVSISSSVPLPVDSSNPGSNRFRQRGAGRGRLPRRDETSGPSGQVSILSAQASQAPQQQPVAAGADAQSKPKRRRPPRRKPADPNAAQVSVASAPISASQASQSFAAPVAAVDGDKPKRPRRPRKPRNPNVNGVTAPTNNATISILSQPDSKSEAASDSSRSEVKTAPRNQRRNKHGHADKHSVLAKEITARLMADEYECSICTERIGRRGKVWSCSHCYVIIHLTCIQKWAQAKTDILTKSFICPGCALEVKGKPDVYRCFCGKQVEPNYNPYLTPHSCGEVCGRVREGGCPHLCNLPCHPGSCPPCSATGSLKTCPCGNTSYRLRCGEVEKKRRTCENVCNKTLDCGSHKCLATCHDGPCSPCTQTEQQMCFCGKETTARPCSSGTRVIVNDMAVQSYSCDKPCGQQLDCGNHSCQRKCHEGDCAPCTRQPSENQKCACGCTTFPSVPAPSAVQLAAGYLPLRASCLDPLPTCSRICEKLLDCGTHHCAKRCHDGPCGPCERVVKESCRCGRSSMELTCSERLRRLKERAPEQKGEPLFTCEAPCKKRMLCQSHKCARKCCPASNPGREDLAAVYHRCEKVCGKPLSCGRHTCPEFCHLGFCAPCAVTFRDGIPCRCGHTRTQGPVRCGMAVKPVCHRPCSVPRACGHPCPSKCHEGDCGTCVVLVEKLCGGGHTNVPVQCNVSNPSCGRVCGKPLVCGAHSCRRMCHGGPCIVRKEAEQKALRDALPDGVDEASTCGSRCGLKRRDCEHPCATPCHPRWPCPDVPCKEVVTIHCDCKRRSAKAPCGAFSQARGPKPLQCDETCEIEKRNARFRQALEIQKEGPYIPIAHTVLDRLLELGLKPFIRKYEKSFEEFLVGARKNEKTMHFPPMGESQRWLLHQLASYYRMQSENLDRGDNCSIRVLKTVNSAIPSITLFDAVQHYIQNPQTSYTPEPEKLIHFYGLEKGILPADLRKILEPWEISCTLNFLTRSCAVASFHEAQVAEQAKKSIAQFTRFKLMPDQEDETQTALYFMPSPEPTRRRVNNSSQPSASPSASPSPVDGWDDDTTPAKAPSSSSPRDPVPAPEQAELRLSFSRGDGKGQRDRVVIGPASQPVASLTMPVSVNKFSAFDESTPSKQQPQAQTVKQVVAPKPATQVASASPRTAAPGPSVQPEPEPAAASAPSAQSEEKESWEDAISEAASSSAPASQPGPSVPAAADEEPQNWEEL